MNNQNHEVELRLLLNEDEKNLLIKNLKTKGAKLVKSQWLQDSYYCREDVKDFKEIEMDEIGSCSLRLRKAKENDLIENELNIKIITSFGDHNAWEEHEVKLDSSEEMSKILTALNYKVFFTLEKNREVFNIENMTFNIEDINDFGTALEVEIITTKLDAEKAKDDIRRLLKNIGLSTNKIIPKSITNLLMREKSKF